MYSFVFWLVKGAHTYFIYLFILLFLGSVSEGAIWLAYH
jgi:hypothetical protein